MVSMPVFDTIYLMQYAFHVVVAFVREESCHAIIGFFDEKYRRERALQLSSLDSST